MMNNIVGPSKSFLALCQISSSIINFGDAVKRYTGIKLALLSAKYTVLFLIYNAVLLYPGRGSISILETFHEYVSDNPERCFHQTSYTVLITDFLLIL